jgi:hypothetical protein
VGVMETLAWCGFGCVWYCDVVCVSLLAGLVERLLAGGCHCVCWWKALPAYLLAIVSWLCDLGGGGGWLETHTEVSGWLRELISTKAELY